MSAPLVVNTTDGTVWLRRAATRGGLALYAPQDVCSCPEFVMATEAELAEHGIVGSADVLPVPVGPEPQAESLPLNVVAELNNLRMRLAGMANPPREVYLALYEGAEPELFTTAEAARECCDDYAKTDAGENYWDWTVNESGIHIQFWTHADDDRPLGETSGTVTPIVVQGSDDLSELERLRARVAELEAAQTPSGSYPPALPWARLMDHEDLADFLDELAASAITHASSEVALAEVEATCGRWRLIAEAQHGHNTAPGPDVEEYVAPAPSCTRCYGADAVRFVAGGGAVSSCRVCGTDDTAGPSVDKLTRTYVPVASLREDVPDGEHYEAVHHEYRVGHDLPETGGA